MLELLLIDNLTNKKFEWIWINLRERPCTSGFSPMQKDRERGIDLSKKMP